MYANNGYEQNVRSNGQFHVQRDDQVAHDDGQSEVNNVSNVDNIDASSLQDAKPILAERFKTKMCKNFVATGACPYTNHCMFAHGEEQLRTCEDNIRDGLTTENAIKAFHHQQATRLRMLMRLYNSKNGSKSFNSNNTNILTPSSTNFTTTDISTRADCQLQQQRPCTCCCQCAAKQMLNEMPPPNTTAYEQVQYSQ